MFGCRWPETDEFLDEAIAAALEGNAFAAALAGRMPRETGTQFKVWVDHLVMRGSRELSTRLVHLGYDRQPSTYAVGVPMFAHSGGIFPPVALEPAKSAGSNGAGSHVTEVAIKVESVPDFSARTTWGSRSPVIR